MTGNGTRTDSPSSTSRETTRALRSVAFLPPRATVPARAALMDQRAANPVVEASSLLPSGVAVLTAIADGIPSALTIGSLSVVSLHPTVVTFAVRRAGSMHQVISRASGFGLSLLADHQEFTARYFASRHRPDGAEQFARMPFLPGPISGAPLLTEALGWLDCTAAALVPTGSQVLVVGNVEYDRAAPTGEKVGVPPQPTPLLRGGGRFHRAKGTGDRRGPHLAEAGPRLRVVPPGSADR
jgi:flavin reductase (DIM6/NTAB) family NADH-FMN oxidoreductase RutF